MSPDGRRLLGEPTIIYDGHGRHSTIEGPKLYKRRGHYYILAPGGGVPDGWQVALRARHILGPYEDKIVLAQGRTAVNGPHQGAWVTTPGGQDWFLHFQHQGAYGRVVHLQPMRWQAGWPVIGADPDGDGQGEPVAVHAKPAGRARKMPPVVPATSDECNTVALGLQWQWAANPQPTWLFRDARQGVMRLYAAPLPADFVNYWQVPNLLLQKLPAPVFTATTKLTFTPRAAGEKTGLVMMGADYAYLALSSQAGGQMQLSQTVCRDADQLRPEVSTAPVPLTQNTVYLRVAVGEGVLCQFSYSLDGTTFQPVGAPFQARGLRWLGAKVGLFCTRAAPANDAGYADVDWFRVQ